MFTVNNSCRLLRNPQRTNTSALMMRPQHKPRQREWSCEYSNSTHPSRHNFVEQHTDLVSFNVILFVTVFYKKCCKKMYGAENLTMEHTYYRTLPAETTRESVSVQPKKQKRSDARRQKKISTAHTNGKIWLRRKSRVVMTKLLLFSLHR